MHLSVLVRAGLAATAITAVSTAQSFPAFAGPFDHETGAGIVVVRPIADLNGDGRDDMVLKPIFTSLVRYRLSNPNGSFGPLRELPLAAEGAFSAADTGDGTPELFAYHSAGCPGGTIHGFLNGGPTCAAGSPLTLTPFAIPFPCSAPQYIQAVLFRGASMVMAISPGNGLVPPVQRFAFLPPATPGAQPSLVPDGPPYFTALPATFAPSFYLRPVGDLDGDGTRDVLIRHITPFVATTFELVRATPGGLVLNTPTSFIVSPGVINVDAMSADLDADGYAEIIVPGPTVTSVRLFRNHGPVPGGDGGVELVEELMDTGGLVPTDFADFDGDGDLDAIGKDPAGKIHFLQNRGPAGFALMQTVLTTAGNHSAAGDFDGDGDADVLTLGAMARVWLNQLVPSAVSRPGTADALALASDVHDPTAPPQPPTSAPFFDVKNAAPGDAIEVSFASSGFDGAPAMLVAEVFTTGCAPSFPLSHLYATGGATTYVLASFTVPPGGSHALTLAAPALPPGPHNLSGLLQVIVFSTEAANGSYATTEAHEIQM
jgi:hypothetical protein